MSLSINRAIIAIFGSAAIIFITRALPFILFSKKEPPKIIRFIEKYTPSLIIAVLIAYCFKDIAFSIFPYGISFYVGVALSVILHLCFKNTLITIFISTMSYMILMHIL